MKHTLEQESMLVKIFLANGQFRLNRVKWYWK